MKHVIFLLLTTLVCAKAEAMVREVDPPVYWVVSSAPQPGLDSNHAVFELQFSGFQPAESVFNINCNGVFRQIDANTSPVNAFSVSPGKYQFLIVTVIGTSILTDSMTILPGYKTVLSIIPPPIPLINPEMREVLCKPVIYFYPEKDQAVEVTLTPKGNFTFTYPDYEKGWNGTAHPDGSITVNGKTYPYLFWEAEQDNVEELGNPSTGFQVQRDSVLTFLEEKLSEIGFNDTEKTDFITYWAPRMMLSEQGFAHFLFNKEYDALATLSISPKPQEVFRIYLLWTPVKTGILLWLLDQELPKMSRKGFHVVEWGGSELRPIEAMEYKP